MRVVYASPNEVDESWRGVVLVTACRVQRDASNPEFQLNSAVEGVVSRAGVMPGRIVAVTVSDGRFSALYETDDEGVRYRVKGRFEDGGPIVDSVCEVKSTRCLDLDDVWWDEGAAPASA